MSKGYSKDARTTSVTSFTERLQFEPIFTQ